MTTNEARSAAVRPGFHRLLPIAGVTAATAALMVHLGCGALVMHVGVPHCSCPSDSVQTW